jgi:hypothetical protein
MKENCIYFFISAHTHTLRVHIHLLQLLYTLREGGNGSERVGGGGGGETLGTFESSQDQFEKPFLAGWLMAPFLFLSDGSPHF